MHLQNPLTRSAAVSRLRLALALWAIAGLAACASAEIQPVASPQVFIVRHAEKVSGPDPELSVAGKARALALAELLDDAGITRIFSTDTRRTRSTAAPLAQQLGLEIEIYDHREQRALGERIRASGETMLVVGHSNTIGTLAAKFGIAPGKPIDEATEYDRLYVITLAGNEVRGEVRRYGD
ncbi:MAG TPA: phosphoglycerate mutase family protein [Gammaproteobacteria bacterium]